MYGRPNFYENFSKRMLILSILIGLFISITMPVTYFLLNWSEQENIANLHSKDIASDIAKTVKINPELWKFSVIKFTKIFDELQNDKIVHIRIFDSEGHIINDESSPRTYILSRTGSSDIVYNNIRYGHVEVTYIIDNVLEWTLIQLFLFSVLGLLIGLALFKYPAKIIKTAEKDINNNISQLNQHLQEVMAQKDEITYLYKEIASSEEKVRHLAYHDHLTGLPNRLLLSEQLNHAIQLSSRLEKILAIMFLDLNDFKIINDTMGHDKGDQLLIEVSKRLVNTLRKCDTVARIGGDEFIILIEDVENENYINMISEKILKSFNEPYILNNQDCFITTSIGIAIYPIDGINAEELIKNADIAMYKSKGKGKNQYERCTPVMKTEVVESMKMANSLYRALERNEFELNYQPQVSCNSNKIVGVEALIRWNHPEWGRVSPVEFIPIAEQTGLIIPIGEWVLKTACKQNKAWQDAGLPRIRMGVNLSVKQFQNDNLVKDVEGILRETGLDYQYLEFEITESSVMNERKIIIKALHAFKKLGIHIAIDDFGEEYSSLNYLKQLPVDKIKIPMTFIQGIDVNNTDEAITKAIIVLAKSMGLDVIAEGVETKNQFDFLNQQMCNEIQGFYYYKPMPAHELEKLLMKMI